MQGSLTQEQTLETEASLLASLYRTRWLMAHNKLHEAIYGAEQRPQSPVRPNLEDLWNDYLKELESSEDVSRTPA